MQSGRLAMRPVVLRTAVTLLLALAALVALASSSHAAPSQSCDPVYGCTTTSTPVTIASFSCHAMFHGTPGSPQTVDVTGGPPGSTAEVLFNGQVVGSGVADSSGHATVTYEVPGDVGGNVQVIVAGQKASAVCDPVLTVSASGVSGSRSNPGGVLAHTGFGLWLLILAAVALIVAGWLLRRRREARLHHA
jgi:LPXTG-motif cell wall-anchored protein